MLRVLRASGPDRVTPRPPERPVPQAADRRLRSRTREKKVGAQLEQMARVGRRERDLGTYDGNDRPPGGVPRCESGCGSPVPLYRDPETGRRLGKGTRSAWSGEVRGARG